MKKQVEAGLYWFSEADYFAGRAVKLWYNETTNHRGWWCSPLENGEPSGYDYPLSPDIWNLLKSESEMQAMTGKVLS